MNGMLVLENGAVYYGELFGSQETVISEIVFNTSMVGYQEIISHPASHRQILLMNYPLIGNYGMTDEDYEGKSITLSGLVVREYNDLPSNFRFTKTLGEVMTESKVSGISEVDTREIVTTLREQGTMKAMITKADRDIEECLKEIRNTILPQKLTSEVSSKKIWYSRTRNPIFNVVVVDCGVTLSEVKKLNEYGCNVVVAPFNTSKETILNHQPDGLFVSSGPGAPEDIPEVTSLIKEFKGTIPILGAELGCALVALAYGAKTYKMKIGHRGANHPIKDLESEKVVIATQNHAYGICRDSIKNTSLTPTHINLLDSEIEGVVNSLDKVMGRLYRIGDKEYKAFLDAMEKMGGTRDAQKNRY